GCKFDLQRLVPDRIRHGIAGDEFAHAPFIEFERPEAPTRLGMDLFDLDAALITSSPVDGLRPFPATLYNCETHDILPWARSAFWRTTHLICHHSVTEQQTTSAWQSWQP